MNKKIIFLIICAAILAFSSFSYAQSTAGKVVLGALQTDGCPGGYACFRPYSSSNPLPVSLAIVP